MASPTSVSRTTTTVTTASNSWTVNLDPNLASGDLLIIVLRAAEAETSTWPSGFQNFLSDGTNTWHDLDLDASDDTITVIARDCDGAEASSINVTFGTTCKGCAVAYRISGALAHATQAPDILSATGNSTNPDSPSENVTGGPKDILALALDTHAGEQTATVTYPTNYVNTGQVTSGTGGSTATNCQINYCDRQVSAASSEDPSAFTISGAQPWTAITILVQEPAAAGETITGVALSATPSLPAGALQHTLTGVALSATPTLPAGSISAGGQQVDGVVLSATPTLPAGSLAHSLTGVVLSATPTLPAGSLRHSITGVVLTATPTLPAGSLRHALTGVTITATPTLPAGALRHTVTGVVLTATPSLPVGQVTIPGAQTVTGVALTVTPSLPVGALAHTLQGTTLVAAPSLPAGALAVPQTVSGVVLQITPTLPVGTVTTLALGAPVRDPQAVLTGIEGRAQNLGTEGTAVLTGIEGRATNLGTEGTAVLVGTEGKAT